MGRHTGNQKVVSNLKSSLQAFLDDHQADALEETSQSLDLTVRVRKEGIGCGCEDCELAGLLLSRI
jgi:hypothetical protein